MTTYNCSEIPKDVCRLLNLTEGDKVEAMLRGGEVIIRKALTNAEKRKAWVAEILPTIPWYVQFMRNHNTVVAYQRYDGIQRSAFTVCDPHDEFNFSLGKCIAYFRLFAKRIPDYVLED